MDASDLRASEREFKRDKMARQRSRKGRAEGWRIPASDWSRIFKGDGKIQPGLYVDGNLVRRAPPKSEIGIKTDPGLYYDRALHGWVNGLAHRREILRARGLVGADE